jgi:uncharacterized protein YheU (UPF0270 family)
LTVELEVLVGSEGGDGDEEEHALEQEPAAVERAVRGGADTSAKAWSRAGCTGVS